MNQIVDRPNAPWRVIAALKADVARLTAENAELCEALRWRYPPEAPEIDQLVVIAVGNFRWCYQYESDPNQWGGPDDETKTEEFIFLAGGDGDDFRLDEITAWYPVQAAPPLPQAMP